MLHYLRAVWVFSILLSLSGCGALDRINKGMERGDQADEDIRKRLDNLRQESAVPIKTRETPWVSMTPVASAEKPIAPALQCSLVYAPATPVTLFEIAQAITRYCNVRVRITQDAVDAMSGRYANSMSGGAASSGLPPLPPLVPPPLHPRTENSSLAPSAFAGRPQNISIRWTGQPLAGFLDTVTARFGLSWEYRNDAIRIYYLDTRTFRVFARNAKTTMKTTVMAGTKVQSSGSIGSASTSESNGGSTQTTEITSEDSITDDIRSTLNAMHTPGTPPISYAASTGTVIVTDTPDVLDQIETYLTAENKVLTRQVLFFVQVLEVELTNTDQLGIDWSTVYHTLSGKYGLSLTNNFAVDSSAMSASGSVLNTATGGAAAFAGTKFIVNALSGQGKVVTNNQPILRTLNLRTAPLQISTETGYLAQSSTSQTANVGSMSSLTPGIVVTGFNLNLSPMITQGKTMLLDFDMNFSPDPKITKKKSGDSSIEVPTTSKRLFRQSISIESGQTMIISGFEQSTEHSEKAGVGETYNWLLGGGGRSAGRRMAVVILVTPIIQD